MTDEKTLTEAGYAKLLTDLRKLWETGKAKAHRAVSRILTNCALYLHKGARYRWPYFYYHRYCQY